MEPTHIHHEPCQRCGGKLEFGDTVDSATTGSLVDFFRCEDCGHVHAVERQAAPIVASCLAYDCATSLQPLRRRLRYDCTTNAT